MERGGLSKSLLIIDPLSYQAYIEPGGVIMLFVEPFSLSKGRAKVEDLREL
jgi:hypothetical protein